MKRELKRKPLSKRKTENSQKSVKSVRLMGMVWYLSIYRSWYVSNWK